MSNPYFDSSPAFKQGGAGVAERTPNGYPTMPGYEPGRAAGSSGSTAAATATAQRPWSAEQPSVSEDQLAVLERSYGAPSATNVDRGRMTYDDVLIRTVGLFAIILAVGAVSWNLATTPATAGLGSLVMIGGALGALVLGLINAFKSEPSPILIMAYAAFEGAMLGAFSGWMEALYPGIVMQAVLGSLVVFGVVLVAYCFAGFRASGRGARILIVAMVGYLLFSLVNFGLMVTGVVSNPWGLRGIEVLGIPLGVVIGALAVIMAAYSLAMDFESIERGVQRGLPRRYAWGAAYGLTVTLVWLYVEILRILAILQSDD